MMEIQVIKLIMEQIFKAFNEIHSKGKLFDFKYNYRFE